MNGAVAVKSKPNYIESTKSIIVTIKKNSKEEALNRDLELIDKEIKRLEQKYVTAVIWKDEKEEKEKSKLILEHYKLKTNKNTKSLEANLELYNHQGKIYYYGLADFIEFCNTWGYFFNKIEKLYLDKLYLYALKKGRLNELKQIEEIFANNNFENILIQKSLNKSQIALNVKRIYIQDLVESIRKNNYDEAINKVIYYSNNFIEKYLTNNEKEKQYFLN